MQGFRAGGGRGESCLFFHLFFLRFFLPPDPLVLCSLGPLVLWVFKGCQRVFEDFKRLSDGLRKLYDDFRMFLECVLQGLRWFSTILELKSFSGFARVLALL